MSASTAWNGKAFLSTRWSMVLSAKEESEAALERLCRTYWPAVFAFSRRCGDAPEDARDLTQGFFEQLLARRWLDQVDQEKGRFRSFLLTAFTRFSRDEWRRTQRQKRGGGLTFVSLDTVMEEPGQDAGFSDNLTPDVAYERSWVEALIHAVMARLKMEFVSAGKEKLFAAIKGFLTGHRSGEMSYAEAAAASGLSESGVKSAIWRMRQRYGEIFRDEVANTVSSPEEVDEEIRHLLSVMGRQSA
ncbi:MAG: sigma-70 family RNA polymerase sigma factor [Verrucomicrobiota bacterium]